MTTSEAIAILREMNKWRRGEPPYDGETPEEHRDMPYPPREFGEAIDWICDEVDHFREVTKMIGGELTWQDCKRIVKIADAIITTDAQKAAWKKGGEQVYYEQVLKLYNEKNALKKLKRDGII